MRVGGGVIMKVLLAGGAGYIGSHTAIEIAGLGHDIVIADDFSNSKPEVLNRLKTIIGKDFPFYRIDGSDKPALEGLFEKEKPDIVILRATRRSANRWKSRSRIIETTWIRRSHCSKP